MSRERISADTVMTAVFLLADAVFLLFAWQIRGETELRGFCAGFGILAAVLFLAARLVFRKAFIQFTDTVCNQVEELSKGEVSEIYADEDTLTSKIQMKLDKLSDIVYATVSSQENQKQEVQQIVSDISHQLKTPIANITMYNAMMNSAQITKEQKAQFTEVIDSQVRKLEFLVDALAKMSRLESSLITLEIKPARIFDTIFQAVSQAGAAAEKKGIAFSMDCEQDLLVPHDAKWTQEAIFNLVDNAVKYTPEGGKVSVRTEVWEMFTKIDITDTGIGIAKEHFEDIFKRFYREGKVHLQEGLGIGLYLSRQIITQQGGYIKVVSKEGEGTTFSVFLPNAFEKSKEAQ